MIGTYLVAFSAMLFAATSALTLFRTVDRFDPPEGRKTAVDVEHRAAA